MSNSPDIITTIGYAFDRRGLQEARQDAANYKFEAVRLSSELKRERVRNLQEFSASSKSALQEQLREQQSVIARQLAAIRGLEGQKRIAAQDAVRNTRAEIAETVKRLGLYDTQIAKVRQLESAQAEAASRAREASAAAGSIRAGGVPTNLEASSASAASRLRFIAGLAGVISIPFLTRRIARAAIIPGAEAQQSFANVSTLLQGPPQQAADTMKELKDEVLALDPALGDANDLAKALYETLSRGVAPADAIKVVGAAAKFSKSGLADMDTATRALVGTMQAYGIQADKVENVSSALFTIVKLGGTTLDELTSTLGRLSNPAHLAGISLGEMGGALAEITTKGVPTDQAVTGLRAALHDIINPSKEAKNAAIAMGTSFDKIAEDLHKGGLVAAIRDIQKATGGDAKKVGEIFVNRRASLAIAAMLNDLPMLAKDIGMVKEAEASGMATNEAFNKQMATAQGAAHVLGNAWSQFSTVLVDKFTPAAHTAAVALASLLKAAQTVLSPESMVKASTLQGFAKSAGAQLTPAGLAQLRSTVEQIQAANELVAQSRGAAASEESVQEAMRIANIGAAEFRKRAGLGPQAPVGEQQKALGYLFTQEGKTSEKFFAEPAKAAETPKPAKPPAPTLTPEEIASAKRLSEQIASVRAQIRKAQQEAQDALIQGVTKNTEGPLRAAQGEVEEVRKQLQSLRADQASLHGAPLLDNLKQQLSLTERLKQANSELNRLAAAQAASAEKVTAAYKAAVLDPAIMQKQAKSLFGFSPDSFLASLPSAKAPDFTAGHLPLSGFQNRFDLATTGAAVGLFSAEQEKSSLKELQTQLQAEIAQRTKNAQKTQEGVDELAKWHAQLDKVNTVLAKLASQSPFEKFLGSIGEISSTIGRFSPALGQDFGQAGFAAKLTTDSLKALRTVPETGGGVSGSVGQGLKDVFGSLSGFKKNIDVVTKSLTSFGENLATTVSGGGPLSQGAGGAGAGFQAGTAISSLFGKALGSFAKDIPLIGGIAGGAIGLFTGLGQKSSQRTATDIKKQVNDIMDALKTGLVPLKQTLAELEAERVKAVASLSGKKGGQKQLDQLLPGLDSQIAGLKGQQKTILDSFREKLAVETLAPGYRDTAQAIADIAKTLKQAGDAGATAAEQMQFFNASIADISRNLGDNLRSEEMSALQGMTQMLDLQQQRADLIQSTNLQIYQIKASLGLARPLTPGQSARLQIEQITHARDEQLQQIDAQSSLLKAQLGTQSKLFNIQTAGLSVQGQRNALLNAELDIQKQITAESIAQIQAQMADLAALQSGRLPALPAGLLPPGYTLPTQQSSTPTTVVQSPTINMYFPTNPTNPYEFEQMLKEALNSQQYGG